MTGATCLPAWRRASMSRAWASSTPDVIALVIAASTAAAGRVRCASRTSISARVPAASPCWRRAASQYRWWAAVNAPAARAWASAVAPGSAPGL